MQYQPYALKTIRIVSNSQDADMHEKRPPERMHDDLMKVHNEALKGKTRAIDKLKMWIRQFPQFPVFKNLLFVVYRACNQHKVAREVAEQLYREHPDYFYAHTNLAEALLVLSESIHRIPEILHPSLNMTQLFPLRTSFHFGEFIGYEQVVIKYLAASGQTEAATERLDMFKSTGYGDKALFKELADAIAKHKPYEPKLPTLQTPGLEVLYFAGDQMLPEVLREILQQPRQALVADLIKILDDSVERADFWTEDGHPEAVYMAPVWVLLLLCELQADEVLPDILRFLATKEAKEFWLGSYVTEFLGDLMARFAKPENYERLFEYATNRQHNEYVCSAIYESVCMGAMLRPELEAASEQWLERVIEALGKDIKPGEVDDHLSLAINAIPDFNLQGLLPLAKKYHDLEVIDTSISGDFEDFVGYMGEQDKTIDYIDLESGCRHINNFSWKSVPPVHYPNNEWLKRILDHSAHLQSAKEDTSAESAQKEPDVPLDTAPPLEKRPQMSAPSLNAPCPCGSGKKYKRCCGK